MSYNVRTIKKEIEDPSIMLNRASFHPLLQSDKFFAVPKMTELTSEIDFPLPSTPDKLGEFMTKDGKYFIDGVRVLLTQVRDWALSHQISSPSLTKILENFSKSGCDVLLRSSPPSEWSLHTLAIYSNAAYIRVNAQDQNELYYVHKAKRECIKLDLDKDKLNEFDKAVVPATDARTLSAADLNAITVVTSHTHEIKINLIDFPLFKDGVVLLASIKELIYADKLPLDICKATIHNLMPGLTVCAPGTFTNLNDAYLSLTSNAQLILMSIKKVIAQQTVLALIQENPQLQVYVGNEIHYVNAVLNYYASDIGIESVIDAFAPNDEEVMFLIHHFPSKFAKAMDISKLLEMMIAKFDLVTLEKNLTSSKVCDSFEEALSQYGKDSDFNFSMHLIDQDALEEDIYKLDGNAEFYLWTTMLHRLANSGFFNKLENAMIMVKVGDDIAYLLTTGTLKLSFVQGCKERVPFIPYCLDACARGQTASLKLITKNAQKAELHNEILKRLRAKKLPLGLLAKLPEEYLIALLPHLSNSIASKDFQVDIINAMGDNLVHLVNNTNDLVAILGALKSTHLASLVFAKFTDQLPKLFLSNLNEKALDLLFDTLGYLNGTKPADLRDALSVMDTFIEKPDLYKTLIFILTASVLSQAEARASLVTHITAILALEHMVTGKFDTISKTHKDQLVEIGVWVIAEHYMKFKYQQLLEIENNETKDGTAYCVKLDNVNKITVPFIVKLYVESFFDTTRLDTFITEYFLYPQYRVYTEEEIAPLLHHPNFSADLYLFTCGNTAFAKENGDVYSFRNLQPKNSVCLDLIDKAATPEVYTNISGITVKEFKNVSGWARPILMLTLKNKDVKGLELLLKANANLDLPSYYYVTDHKEREYSDNFYHKNCWIGVKRSNYYGDNFRYALLYNNDTILLDAFIKARPSYMQTPLPNGEMPIEFAINTAPKETAIHLLNMGYTITNLSKISLLDAANKGLTSFVKALVDAGADINQTNHRNETAIYQAIIGRSFDIVEYLLKKGAKFSKLIENEKMCNELNAAVKHCDAKLIEMIFSTYHSQQHFDVSKMTSCGVDDTLLHIAVRSQNIDAVYYLLENTNIDVTQVNACKETAIGIAKQNGLYTLCGKALETKTSIASQQQQYPNASAFFQLNNNNANAPEQKKLRALIQSKQVQVEIEPGLYEQLVKLNEIGISDYCKSHPEMIVKVFSTPALRDKLGDFLQAYVIKDNPSLALALYAKGSDFLSQLGEDALFRICDATATEHPEISIHILSTPALRDKIDVYYQSYIIDHNPVIKEALEPPTYKMTPH